MWTLIGQIARRAKGIRGWTRLVVAFLLGALMSLGFAPFHFFPVFLIGFSGVLLLLRGVDRGRSAFALGWWFGWGHFIAGLYWIASAFLVEPEKFAWMVPFPLLGLPAVLAVFPALSVWVAWRLSRHGSWRMLLLAAVWTLLEVVRGQLLTGFPWNLVGYGFGFADAAMQSAAWVGVFGLSFLTVLVGSAPALLMADRRAWRIPGAVALLFALVIGAGAMRLPSQEQISADNGGPMVRIVQANVPQREKWRPDRIEPNFARHLAMSIPAEGEPKPDIIIWPETSATFLINEHQGARQRMAIVAGQLDAVMLTGAPRVERSAAGDRFFNSGVAINAGAEIVATADKRHLVPFGEYLPFRQVLSRIGLEKLAQGRGDFSAGAGDGLLKLPGLPNAKVLICYEVIFDDEAASDGERPGWLLSLTNDAWFGELTGPDQHFAMARFRAVEQALPMVRAAGTGISAVVDPYGQVRMQLDLGASGVVSGNLPAPAQTSLFSIAGSWPTVAICFLVLLFGFVATATGHRR
ncbi:MAG: apolipoprotein N-acyltransferase [Minwuia sp.]|nr:apolipoprotein N-acyltransferase [Minwuia sp.]